MNNIIDNRIKVEYCEFTSRLIRDLGYSLGAMDKHRNPVKSHIRSEVLLTIFKLSETYDIVLDNGDIIICDKE